jgi:hypothetical protein
MFDKPIDFTKLHKELSSTYRRQMAIKKEFPHRYESPPNELWFKDRGASYAEESDTRKPWRLARQEFSRLSYRMTKLCCILNHAKGKLHMKSYSYLDAPIVDMEWQYNFIDEDAKEFYKEDDLIEAA